MKLSEQQLFIDALRAFLGKSPLYGEPQKTPSYLRWWCSMEPDGNRHRAARTGGSSFNEHVRL